MSTPETPDRVTDERIDDVADATARALHEDLKSAFIAVARASIGAAVTGIRDETRREQPATGPVTEERVLELAAEPVIECYAERAWGYDPNQHKGLVAKTAAAIRTALAEERAGRMAITEPKTALATSLLVADGAIEQLADAHAILQALWDAQGREPVRVNDAWNRLAAHIQKTKGATPQ